jgi:hypothetical protein
MTPAAGRAGVGVRTPLIYGASCAARRHTA